MATTFFEQSSLALLLMTSITACGWAQTANPIPKPPAVLSQTIRGVTVQLTQAGWIDIQPTGDEPFAFYRSFEVTYAATASSSISLPPGKTPMNFITDIEAINPAGFPVPLGGSGPNSVNWDYVDPRWPLIAVNVDFLDPAAPPQASGRSAGPITITNIPVPSIPDVDTPVHAEVTTSLGTRVIVESVKVSPNVRGIRTTFTLHIIPTPEAFDLRFGFSTGTKVTDDAGTDLSTGSASTSGASSGGPTYGSGFLTAGVGGIPHSGAKTMRLTLDADESSDLLKQDAWFRHFHLLVPLHSTKAGGRQAFPVLATVGNNVIATLDSVGWQENRYRTRIVLRDRRDPEITWRLHRLRGKDNAGHELLGTFGSSGFFWKCDGSPLMTGEESVEAYVGAPGDADQVKDAPLGAKTLSLTADVTAFREHYHLLDFSNIPIPAPGQTLVLNRRVQDAEGAYLVLRKVAAFSPEHPLPTGFDYPLRQTVVPPAPSGLVVVLAEPSASKEKGITEENMNGKKEFDFSIVAANDPAGRHLRPVHSLSFAPGDALLGATPLPKNDLARVMTFYFRTATPGAHKFNLRLYRKETIRLDRAETITFPDIPAPVATSKP